MIASRSEKKSVKLEIIKQQVKENAYKNAKYHHLVLLILMFIQLSCKNVKATESHIVASFPFHSNSRSTIGRSTNKHERFQSTKDSLKSSSSDNIPTTNEAMLDSLNGHQSDVGNVVEPSIDDNVQLSNQFGDSHGQRRRLYLTNFGRGDVDENNEDNSQDLSDFSQRHHRHQRRHLGITNPQQNQIQTIEELNPISLGIEGGERDNVFSLSQLASPQTNNQNSDTIDQANNLNQSPIIPFNLSPVPQLLGFQSPTYETTASIKQDDQPNIAPLISANLVSQDTGALGVSNEAGNAEQELGSSQQVVTDKDWPKIFKFTDGRANLSEFEREKKVRLSKSHLIDKNNQIDSQVIFDGRPIRRKSFLILHGGILS